MKLLFLALATLALTLNALGLELVKCGSIKLDAASAALNAPGGAKLLRAKPDGTSLYFFSRNAVVIVIPFIQTFQITPYKSAVLEAETNHISEQFVDGVLEVKYAVRSKVAIEMNDLQAPFATANRYGYLNYKRVKENDNGWTEYTVRGDAVSTRQLTVGSSKEYFWFEKIKYSEGIVERVELPPDQYLNSYFNINTSPEFTAGTPEFRVKKNVVVPKLEGGSLNFYIVTDPDLFPDTALGAPRVEGGSATFNVTTGSEEPLEIQASDDLKIWKRLKTLEDANGRSVTVPADAAQGFLRAVER